LIPLPKSTHLDRIKNNIDVFNFSLSSNEIKTIDKKVKIKRILPSPNKGK
jgi:diketogulonate reductase-like aldo/keto reductase